jgi:MOSC domain-containing protein YiiM
MALLSRARWTARLVTILVSLPRAVQPTGDGGHWDRVWYTSYLKEPVAGPVMLRETNLDGDRQTDTERHGGPDRAVLCYPGEHYPLWRAELGDPTMTHGGFGENFTVAGQNEDSVCVGDIYEVGPALVQVSTPRRPCYKVAWRWRRVDMVERIKANGRHGWYVRVLREGLVEAGQSIVLVDRPHPEWTVRRAGAVIRLPQRHPREAASLAACGALAESERRSLLSTATG